MANKVELVTLSDGRTFPTLNSETLSWSIGLYHTSEQQSQGFPKMRAVIRAMLQNDRRSYVELERREMLKASFDRMFGNNADRVESYRRGIE